MFCEDYIFLGLDVNTKEEALSFVSEKALEFGITDNKEGLYSDFLKRESELSTGLEDGFAIPHAKSEHAKKTAIIYVSLNKPLTGWETFDDEPVTNFFALIVPMEKAGNEHLMMISKLATALMEDDFKSALKESADKKEITNLILKAMKEEN